MGLRCNARVGSQMRPRLGALRGSASILALATAALLCGPAWADVGTGSTVKISTLGSSATLAGGTVQVDAAKSYGTDFSLTSATVSTIDATGVAATLSGKFTGAGGITFSDSVGGGVLTISNGSSTYTGATTISQNATVALTDDATLADSSGLTVNGTFDISDSNSGATITSLSGSGAIKLGSLSLTMSDGLSGAAFSGVISGTGSVGLTAGTETFSGVNTYTGSTTISSGTLYLTGAGSIASSASVNVYGTLDMSGANSATLKSLSGSGTVVLGSNDLTITNSSGVFYGTLSTTGKLVLTGGTQFITGGSTIGNGITVSGGTLQLGSLSSDISVAYNIVDNAVFAYDSGYAIAMSGVVSGTGAVTKLGTGIATISTVQTYTGSTTISSGTIKLTSAGSIASSSGVQVDSVFDLTEANSATITSLTGIGTVRLGDQSLTITNGAGDFSGTITGSGTLTIKGGSQSFSGANTYTGATTINSGGTLVLVVGASMKSAVTVNTGGAISIATGVTSTGSATIVSLGGTGTVALGANTLVLSGAGHEYAGVISGTGGLWISGGAEKLSGANTYTGTTTVSAGTLYLTGSLATTSKLNISGTLDASGATGTKLAFAALTGAGTVNIGALPLVLSAASGNFSGVIQGTAGVEIAGGTQILSGANTYTGTTTIDSGATLQVGNGGSSGALASVSAVTDNGTLRFYRLDSSTFANQISGSGAVIQGGIGTTILTADNTYTGGTTITAGTLQIGGGGTTGSIQGNIEDDGTLAFARSDAVTINAAIAGSGNLTIASGTITLTGASSYTGVTKINSGGELDLSGSAAIAASNRVTVNGTFDISGATTSGVSITSLAGAGAVKLGSQTLALSAAGDSFSGVISGTGGLTVTSGTQTLSGINTYTGATTVNGGTLSVTGSIAGSALTVNSGGTITGTGKVAALTVASNGTVKATNSGTLSASGNIAFLSGSKYQVDLTSSGTVSTILTTTGTATVTGSTLTVTSSDGTYDLGNPIAILKASGGITGTFTSSQTFSSPNNAAVFKSSITTTATEVDLTVSLYQLTPAIAAITAPTVNQQHVAAGIDAAIAKGSAVPAGFEALGNDTTPQLSTAASQLAGEIGADAPLAAGALFNPFLDALSERTAMLRPLARGATRPLETWISAYDGSSIVDGDETGYGSHKFRSNVAGVVMGAQWAPWSNTLIGGAIAAGTSTFRIGQDLGKGNAKSFEAGVYGYIQASRHFYNSFSAGVGTTQVKTSRTINVSGTDVLVSSQNAFTFGGRYEAGLQMRWFTPYIGVQDQITMLPSYTEGVASGSANFALKYDSRTYNSGRVEVGLRHYIDIEVTPRWILTPDFTLHINDRLAYAHDLSDGSQTGAAFAALPSSDFTVFGAKAKKDAVLGTLGADVLFDNGLRITTHIDTAFSQKSQSFTGFAGVGYTW